MRARRYCQYPFVRSFLFFCKTCRIQGRTDEDACHRPARVRHDGARALAPRRPRPGRRHIVDHRRRHRYVRWNHSRRRRRRKEQRDVIRVAHGHVRSGRVHHPRAQRRHLHRDGFADRVQDRDRQRRAWSTPACPRRSRPCSKSAASRSTVVVQRRQRGRFRRQSSTVSTTLNVERRFSKLPLTSRNALDFVVNLPGVNTPAGIARLDRQRPAAGRDQHHARRHEHPGQLPEDDRRLLRARLSPRLDAIEEVTVTSAANGADSAGQGAVQHPLHHAVRHQRLQGQRLSTTLRHDALNANTWFNNRDLPPDSATGKAPKTELRQYQPGFAHRRPDRRFPGLWDGRNKAFFFFNYEDTRVAEQDHAQPRRSCTPQARQGVFRYTYRAATSAVNLLQLAGAQRPDRHARSEGRASCSRDIRSATAQRRRSPTCPTRSCSSSRSRCRANNFTPYPTGAASTTT